MSSFILAVIHGAGEGFAAGVWSGKEPVVTTNTNGSHTAFGYVIADGHAAIVQEQGEGGPSGGPLAKSLLPGMHVS